MNPNFRKTSQDSKTIRKQYLAGLALEASNNQKNQNANLIYKSTGATPTQAQDLRGTTEKYAGEMGAKQLIVDTLAGANILNAITASTAVATMNGEDIEFFHKYKDYILENFKGRNVPASVFVDYLRKLREKTNATHGVEFNLQQDAGERLIASTSSLVETIAERDEFDAALRDLERNGEEGARFAKIVEKYRLGLRVLRPTDEEARLMAEIAATELAPEINDIQELFAFAVSVIPDDLNEMIAGIRTPADFTHLADQISPAAIRDNREAAVEARFLLKKLKKKFDKLDPEPIPPEPEVAAAEDAEDPAERGADWFGAADAEAEEKADEFGADEPEEFSTTLSVAKGRDYRQQIIDDGTFTDDMREFEAMDAEGRRDIIQGIAEAGDESMVSFLSPPLLDAATGDEGKLERIFYLFLVNKITGLARKKKTRPEPVARGPRPRPIGVIPPPPRGPPPAGGPARPPPEVSGSTTPAPGGAPPGSEGRGMRGRGIGRRKKSAVERSDGYSKPASYKQFGRYLVNHHKLNDGILMIKSPSGAGVKEIPTEAITHRLAVVMKHMAMGQKPPLEDYERLTADEKSKLHKVAKHSRVEGYGIPNPQKSSEESEMDRFSILRGEIVAGNDSSVVAKEFKMLLMKFMREGRVPRRQGNEILEELLRMGH